LYHTILYYKIDDHPPVLLVSIIDNSRLHIELLNHIYDVSTPLPMNQWHHVSIAHHLSRSEGIKIMINGSLVVVLISSKLSSHDKRNHHAIISSGGDFFVGQTIRTINVTSISTTEDFEFDTQRAFYGEIA
ncbi:unnamed protein product, partial [Adineta steineri]